MTPYQQLEQRFRRVALVGDAVGMLHWDMSTVMPEGGAAARGEQMATLRVISHEILAAPETGELIEQASAGDSLGPWQAANLREMRRQWVHATAVSADLVERLSRTASALEMLWREARPKSDFAMVRPKLEEVLGLVREVAAAKAAKLGCPLYDALLDEYEPGGSSQAIDRIFDDLAAFLPGFIDQVIEAQAKRPAPLVPKGPFPADQQRALGERLMRVLGFDFNHGRLDVSLHPFCGGATDDVRITTRYAEDGFAEGMMGVLHETGHALYELGRPAEWKHQPVGSARGMGMHESQSLLIEMQACRSREFLEFVAPLIREAFGGSGPAYEADNLYRLATRVERSFIRTEADEVTYPAHVILRYRLERAMIEGTLEIAELPQAFNDGLEALLGIRPPDDKRGCLQDIHWFVGAWGYFPTYTLGAMTAAQLFAAAKAADPTIVPGITKGDFAPLLAWLRANVHAKGSLLNTDELLTEATGRPLDPAAYMAHLEARYLT